MNQTDETNQTDQIDEMDQTDEICQMLRPGTLGGSYGYQGSK
jgi:hypothetical protein